MSHTSRGLILGITVVLWMCAAPLALAAGEGATQRRPDIIAAEVSIRRAEGRLPAHIYAPAHGGPFPVVVYFHGEGWTLAERRLNDGAARELAKASKSLVVSLDSRRTAERQAADWDDALAAYRWTLANASKYHGDSRRVSLAGEGVGGNLALATAIAARNAGLPKPVRVVSVYPAERNRAAMMQGFFDHVARSQADLADARLQLVNARLADLPPVTLINARFDSARLNASAVDRAGLGDGPGARAALSNVNVPVQRAFVAVTPD